MIFIRTLIPNPLLIAFIAIATYSFICTLLLTPLIRKFALSFNFVDKPDNRRIHAGPIPNIGGIAFAISFLSGIWLASFFHPAMQTFFSNKLIGLTIAIVVIISAGLYDDAHGLNFIQKFSIQAVVGLIVYSIGYRITSLPTLIYGPIELGWLSLPVTILWVSAICNAINLIDGLDGLASGLVTIASTILFFLSVVQNDIVSAFISIILAAITTAFLYYNSYPAKIFMGDTGSLFLGLVLSFLVLEKVSFANSTNQLSSSIVILGIPIFDMILTIIRRAIKKRHLFRADRLHIHHRLIDMLGMSHKKAVFTLYGWGICFGSIGFIITFGGNSLMAIGYGIILLVIAYATTKLHYFN